MNFFHVKKTLYEFSVQLALANISLFCSNENVTVIFFFRMDNVEKCLTNFYSLLIPLQDLRKQNVACTFHGKSESIRDVQVIII